MATKKPKKKAKKAVTPRRRAPSHEERLRADIDLSCQLNTLRVDITALRASVISLGEHVNAQRETIERLDLTIARGLASVAQNQPIDTTLYPGVQDGGVPAEVATKAYDKAHAGDSNTVMAQTAMSAQREPTDAELLS